MSYFLTSERLGFRHWSEGDRALAIALWGDPQVTRHIAASPPSRDAALARLAGEVALQRDQGVQYWPLFLRESGAHVGCCGLHPYEPGVPELGVHLLPDYWRRGLAREAARAVIAYAFDELRARALFAGHNPANSGSRALLLSLGFEWTHDAHYPPTGAMHPSYRLTAP